MPTLWMGPTAGWCQATYCQDDTYMVLSLFYKWPPNSHDLSPIETYAVNDKAWNREKLPKTLILRSAAERI